MLAATNTWAAAKTEIEDEIVVIKKVEFANLTLLIQNSLPYPTNSGWLSRILTSKSRECLKGLEICWVL